MLMEPQQITASLILIFCMFTCINVAAQKTEAYKIEYGVVLSHTSLQDTFANDRKSMITAYVNQKQIHVDERGYSPYVQISDLTDSISFKYFTDLDSSKLALRVPLVMPKLSIDPFSEEQDLWDSSQMALILSDETTIVSGYECHLARFSLGKSNEVLVWYVKGLPQLFWADYDYLQRVPGLPLKITTNDKESNFSIGIAALSVEKTQVDVSLFKVPVEYKILSSENNE